MSERGSWGLFSDPNKKARMQVKEAITFLNHTQNIVNDLREAARDVPSEKAVVFDAAISKMTTLAMDEICQMTANLSQPKSIKGFLRKVRLYFGFS